MTDTDRMVAWLRDTLDAAQLDAEAATPGPWHASEHKYDEDFEAQIGSYPEGADIAGHGWEGGGVDTMATAHHMVRHHPAAVLRQIDRHRKILDDLLAETHQAVEDPWYTCAAATEEHDGGRCDETRRGKPCDCGRDERVSRRMHLLAEGWGWTEEATTGE